MRGGARRGRRGADRTHRGAHRRGQRRIDDEDRRDGAGATGILATDNTGATITFAPLAGGTGLEISTTSSTAFQATGGGTLNITGADNDITTNTGTVLNWSGVSVGGSGVSFDIIQSTISTGGTKFSFSNVDGGTIDVNVASVAGTTGGGHGLTIIGGSAATFNFDNFAAGSVTGDAIQITGAGNGNVTIGTVLIEGGSDNALLVDSNSGTVTINGGTIGASDDPAGIAIDINAGTGNITIGASIAKTTAGDIVEITGRTGGTVTFTGNFSATGNVANGIDINGNTRHL